jgi:hypothetical protein
VPFISAEEPAIEHRQQEEREEGAADDPADDDGGERALHLGASAFADGHGDEAEAGDHGGHQNGAQALQAAFAHGLLAASRPSLRS